MDTIDNKHNITTSQQNKAVYQRALRAEKKESWKSFCSRNLNGDIFGELKTLTNSSPPITFPSELSIDGVIISDHSDILSAFRSHFFPVNPPDNLSHKIVSDFIKTLFWRASRLLRYLCHFCWSETCHGVLAPYQVPGPGRYFRGLVEPLVWVYQIPLSSPILCLFIYLKPLSD